MSVSKVINGAFGWKLLLILVPAVLTMWLLSLREGRPVGAALDNPSGTNRVTFCKDIAPIILNHCASCHRPGESAPFSLITYQDVRKHAQAIVEVTGNRYMPPWLPDPGEVEFVGARRLTEREIELMAQWHAEGDPEGSPADLPQTPSWPNGWQLGKPDLVVSLERPYTLPSSGRDVYRNFVLRLPIATNQYVSAIEFRAGSRAIHHAFMRFDRTPASRRADGQDGEPGFDGMDTPPSAEGAEGYFLSWQPGKQPLRSPDGMSWRLMAGTDLVLQLHMQVSGKPERIQPSVAFYFTDKPPTKIAFKIGLLSQDIDIPAGAREYWVKDEFLVPVDVYVLGLLPHAHYLGKELRASAMLPDGSTKSLLRIRNWDFNWQGDYRFVEPVFLPKGTKLMMDFSYDNSTNNIRNPNHPPKRVRYGLQTTDEMAGLMVQVLLRNRADLETLSQRYEVKVVRSMITFNSYLLQLNPADARAHVELGKALWALGKKREAFEHFQTAVTLKPTQGDAHYHLGMMLDEANASAQAEREYREALRLSPELFEAHNNLGLLLLQKGRFAEAEQHFLNAIRLNPDDEIARSNLELVKKARAAR